MQHEQSDGQQCGGVGQVVLDPCFKIPKVFEAGWKCLAGHIFFGEVCVAFFEVFGVVQTVSPEGPESDSEKPEESGECEAACCVHKLAICGSGRGPGVGRCVIADHAGASILCHVRCCSQMVAAGVC